MCDPILVTILKMQPRYSQSSRENATPSSGTVFTPPPPAVSKTLAMGIRLLESCFRIDFSLKSSHSEINEVLVGTYHWSMSCFAALAQDK